MPHLDILPLAIFGLTYIGLAAGRVPGLALDRTGVALLGAVAYLATGVVSLEDAKDAVDAPTLAVLFGMMLLSAQYELSGLYGAIATRLAAASQPRRLLLGALVVSALLSAVLTNDVICFALTPLLGLAVLRARLPPLPFFAALACAANLGSALTPIGNPQNILIAQKLRLPFLPFILACAAPVAAGLVFTYFWIARNVPKAAPAAADPAVSAAPTPERTLDRRQAAKAVALTVLAIGLFLSPVPAGVTALAIAGVVLANRRMHTRDMLALVDWQLLALFLGLFVVNRGLERSGWTMAAQEALRHFGADIAHPAVLAPALIALGNLVGNVPATMMLLPFVPPSPQIGWTMALVSTLAGNAVLVGSIANLIVAEQAARLGVRFGFREHLCYGLPVTIASLVAAAVAIAFW